MFTFPSRLLLVTAALGLAVTLSAQTYVGNLDGSSIKSTFTGASQGALGTAVPDWWVLSGANVIVYNNTNNVVIDLSGAGFGSYEVAYYIATQLVPNSTYTLSFTMGYVSGNYPGQASYAFSLNTFDGTNYTVLGATSGGPVSSAGGGFATTNPSGSLTTSVTYTTGATVSTDPIAIKWSSSNAGTTQFVDANYFGFDNVTLSYVSAVPEPSTYAALLGAGALGFAIWQRRRRPAV